MIETERLVLHAMPAALVSLLVAGDLKGARATEPPYDITGETFVNEAGLLAMRDAQLQADPTIEPWLVHVAVMKGTRQVVGRAGFHAAPDAHMAVEIGYSVDPTFRRQGYAAEMARAMIGWAATQGVRRCLASARPDNIASLRIIAALGFVRIGEQMDDIDGLEWVHSLDLTNWS